MVKVELITSEGGTLQSHKKPLGIKFNIYMPEENMPNMALSIQVFNQQGKPVLYNWIFDIDQTICRKKGINHLCLTYPEIRLYKGTYFIRVHLAETKTKRKFQQFDCCYFDVEMLNLSEPEWGWQEGVCQYLEKGNWSIN